MSALTAPALEQLLALTLAKVAQLERSATAANLRALDAETERDVAFDTTERAVDMMDKLTNALKRVKHETSQTLRHEATQAVVQMRNAAHSLKAAGRPTKATELEERAAKLLKALEV